MATPRSAIGCQCSALQAAGLASTAPQALLKQGARERHTARLRTCAAYRPRSSWSQSGTSGRLASTHRRFSSLSACAPVLRVGDKLGSEQVSKLGSVEGTLHRSAEDTNQLQSRAVSGGALLLQTSVERPQVRSAGPDCGENTRATAVCIGPRRVLAVCHRFLLQLVQQRWHSAADCVSCGALGVTVAEASHSNQRTFLNLSRHQLLLVLDHTTARGAPCS